MTTTTVERALRDGAAVLRRAGIETPAREARMLLSHALARPAMDLLGDRSAIVDTVGYDALLTRRAAHEPMAYIIGQRGFWSLDFLVSPATLIPRPDSEAIVEAALLLPSPGRVLDLGTGTGCLLLAVLHERPTAFGVGIDISEDAARLANANADRLGLGSRAAFLCGDWAEAMQGAFDLVLSNPPYIESATVPVLLSEVSDHEPRRALDGGRDGLDAYRIIVRALPGLLARDGAAVLEVGAGQARAVAFLASAVGFAASFRQDLGGIERAVILRRDQARK